jgi:hypothetical protein
MWSPPRTSTHSSRFSSENETVLADDSSEANSDMRECDSDAQGGALNDPPGSAKGAMLEHIVRRRRSSYRQATPRASPPPSLAHRNAQVGLLRFAFPRPPTDANDLHPPRMSPPPLIGCSDTARLRGLIPRFRTPPSLPLSPYTFHRITPREPTPLLRCHVLTHFRQNPPESNTQQHRLARPRLRRKTPPATRSARAPLDGGLRPPSRKRCTKLTRSRLGLARQRGARRCGTGFQPVLPARTTRPARPVTLGKGTIPRDCGTGLHPVRQLTPPPGGWHGLATLGRGSRILESLDPALPKPHLATRPVEAALGLRTRARPWETPGRGCLHGGADHCDAMVRRTPSASGFVASSLPSPALLKPLSAAPVRIFDKSAAAAPAYRAARAPGILHDLAAPDACHLPPRGRHARAAQSSILNPRSAPLDPSVYAISSSSSSSS